MKDWFMGLEMRERRLVAGGAVVLGLLLLYLVILEPAVVAYSDLKQNVAAQQETLDWMKQASRKVKMLSASARGGTQGLGGRSLLAVVDQSARSDGLGPAIKRVEPDGSKGVKIWLEGAAFDPMVLWLGKLNSTYLIEPSVITIEPQGAGRVNARLTLTGPAT